MADTALPSLTAGAACAAADLFYTTQSGNSRKVTGAQLQTLARSAARFPYVVGRWYALIDGFVNTGTAVANGTAQFNPFLLARPITVSDLGARINTLSVAGNFQLAIYASDPTTGLPTGSQLAATGNISTTLAVVVTADITGADVLLPVGAYYAAWNSDNATAKVMAISNGATYGSAQIGSTTASELASATGTGGIYLTTPLTFGTWGDLTSATFTVSTNANGGVNLLAKAA